MELNDFNGYKIERVTPAHYPLLTELYADAFGSTMPEEAIAKRFDTKKLGCGHIGFIALTADRLVAAAYYGVFPVKLIRNNEIMLAAQSGDTMTHSLHRMKGLFVHLARLTYEECTRLSIKLVFGQPNQYSLQGLIRLNWIKIDTIVRYDLKLKFKTPPLGRLKIMRSLHRSLARAIIKKKIVTEPGTFTNTLPVQWWKVLRSGAYIDYKKSADKYFIKIDDIIFWIRLTDVLWIGDISDYSKVTHSTISQLRRMAFRMGYNTITFNINKSAELPPVFNCFRKQSEEQSMYYITGPLTDFDNILLTGADFDTW